MSNPKAEVRNGIRILVPLHEDISSLVIQDDLEGILSLCLDKGALALALFETLRDDIMPPAGIYEDKYLHRAGGLIKLEHSHEGTLRDLDCTDLPHPLLAFLLLLEKLSLSGDITTVALCGHILPDLLDSLTGNDLGADSGLDRDVELGRL